MHSIELLGHVLLGFECVKVLDGYLEGWRTARIISFGGPGYAGTVLTLALRQLGVDSHLFDGAFAA